MCAFDGRISLTLAPSVSKWRKTRNIFPTSALEIASLMMRSGSLPNTMTAIGDPEVACQVAGGSEQTAWFGIQDWDNVGDPDLTAFISGPLVPEIGRCLHQLYMEVSHPGQTDGEFAIFTRRVEGYFLQRFPNDDITDLSSVDPQHP